LTSIYVLPKFKQSQNAHFVYLTGPPDQQKQLNMEKPTFEQIPEAIGHIPKKITRPEKALCAK
jgi:hypothetical protein